MPWTVENVDEHMKGLSPKQKKAWVAMANSTLGRCTADGKDGCDAEAIRVANAMAKNTKEDGSVDWPALANLEEAVTIKAQAQRLMNDVDTLLQDRTVPSAVRTALDALHAALKKTWSDLQDEAANGPKPRAFPIKVDKATGEPMAAPSEDVTMNGEAEILVTPPDTALSESAGGMDILNEGEIAEDAQGPLTMQVALIEPGFGNKAQNRYYSKEVLRRDAAKFIGAKMYETDHRDEEKSTKSWVSFITGIKGFTPSGAPIGEVVVFEPSFAQRMRNLKASGLLDKMECSILGAGDIHPGKIDGKQANVVEAITSISSVDWVTRAGAGGRALDIAEAGTDDPAPIVEEVQVMNAAQILKALRASGLPDPAQDRLVERDWKDEAELAAAVEQEELYVKALTESLALPTKAAEDAEAGKPFDMGASKKVGETEVAVEEKSLAERESAIIKSYLG